MGLKRVKTRRKETLDTIQQIIGDEILRTEGQAARDFVKDYVENHYRITARCSLSNAFGKLPEDLRGNDKADKRDAIRAAMMLAWAISGKKEHRNQMKEWLPGKTVAEIQEVVAGLWQNRLTALANADALKGSLTEKLNLLEARPEDYIKRYPMSIWLHNNPGGAGNLRNFTMVPLATCTKTVKFRGSAADNPFPYNLDDQDGAAPKTFYCLPWKSEAVTGVQLPNNPADRPTIFVTDSLKGCSVFIVGPRTTPTVYHAGRDGAVSAIHNDILPELETIHGPVPDPALVPLRDANQSAQFWRALFRKLNAGAAEDGEVHKDMYSNTARLNVINQRMTLALARRGCRGSVIDDMGCVMGRRVGNDWDFYMQQCVLMQYNDSDGAKVRVALPVCVMRVYPNRELLWDGQYQMLPDVVDDTDLRKVVP